MSDYILTDEMLSSAAKQVRTAMLDAMPKPSEYTYEFTEEFDEAMRPLLKRASRHKSIDKFAPGGSCFSCRVSWLYIVDGD